MRSFQAVLKAVLKAVLGLGLGLGIGATVLSGPWSEARGQSGGDTSREEVRINRRIAREAMRRSNLALNLLRPVRAKGRISAAAGSRGVLPGTGRGWTAQAVADGAIGRDQLAEGVRGGGSSTVAVGTGQNVPGNQPIDTSVTCPKDTVATGGGYVAGGNVSGLLVTESVPDGEDGWLIEGLNTGSGEILVTPYAACLETD